jgi:carbon storage regulator
MLVLSRKCRQQIVIGNEIEITVVGVQGNCVKLGLNAPHHIPIRRAELCVEIPTEEDATPQSASTRSDMAEPAI